MERIQRTFFPDAVGKCDAACRHLLTEKEEEEEEDRDEDEDDDDDDEDEAEDEEDDE
jgi:phosphopantothenoylcysteine synthetase/decarboxylase